MAYKQPSPGSSFKMMGSSPAKQYKQPTGPKAKVKPEELRKVPMTNKEMNKDDFIRTRISEGSIETQELRRKENARLKKVSEAKMKAVDKLIKPSPTKQYRSIKTKGPVAEKNIDIDSEMGKIHLASSKRKVDMIHNTTGVRKNKEGEKVEKRRTNAITKRYN